MKNNEWYLGMNEWGGARINRLVSIRIAMLLVLFGKGGGITWAPG